MTDCKGICEQWPGAIRGARYTDGLGRRHAYCKVCHVSFPLESLTLYDSKGRLICPCCKRVLRQIPRKPKSKIRFLMRFEPAQATLYARA